MDYIEFLNDEIFDLDPIMPLINYSKGFIYLPQSKENSKYVICVRVQCAAHAPSKF